MGGSAIGHVIPGAALFGWGVFLLVLIKKTHQRTWTSSTGLKIGALVQLVASSIALGQELFGGFMDGKPFANKEHLTLHSLYLFSGIVFLLEATGKVPRESWKLAQTFVNMCIALLLYVHAQMQQMEEHHPMEGFTHWLLAVATFGSAFGYFLSWAAPGLKLGGAYLGIISLMVQGMWLLFQSYALYSGDYGEMGRDMDMAVVTSLFVWLYVFATIVVTVFETQSRLASGYQDVVLNDTASSTKSSPVYNRVDNSDPEDSLL